MNNFQTVLRQLRKDFGLTQVDLAKRLGLSRSTIGMYEMGKRNPDTDSLEMIADFFNVDLDFLLGRTNKTTRILGVGQRQFDNCDPAVTAIVDILQSSTDDMRLRLFDLVSDYAMCDEFEQGKISTMASMFAFDHRESKSADDIDRQYYDQIHGTSMVAEASSHYDATVGTPHEYRGPHEDLVRKIRNKDVEDTIEALRKEVDARQRAIASIEVDSKRPAK